GTRQRMKRPGISSSRANRTELCRWMMRMLIRCASRWMMITGGRAIAMLILIFGGTRR
ncbi:hypothetical protein RJ035_008379, partial [Blastomyces gilchristii]